MEFLAYPQFKPESGYYCVVSKTPEEVYAVEYARYDNGADNWYKLDEVAVNFESGKIVVAFLPTPELPEVARI